MLRLPGTRRRAVHDLYSQPHRCATTSSPMTIRPHDFGLRVIFKSWNHNRVCPRGIFYPSFFRVVCFSLLRAAPLRARLLGWGVPFSIDYIVRVPFCSQFRRQQSAFTRSHLITLTGLRCAVRTPRTCHVTRATCTSTRSIRQHLARVSSISRVVGCSL